MDLKELRTQIDDADRRLIEAFEDRMRVSERIGEYKKEQGLPSLDAKREREKLKAITDGVPEDLRSGARVLYSMLFELSRERQNRILDKGSDIFREIEESMQNTPETFPKGALVACQGVEGAYSAIACEKLFAHPEIMYMNSFEGVFHAVEKGLCRYGILPIENSTAGSVLKVYDLMLSHHFHIVRSTRIKVDHVLAALPGTSLKDVREILSHEQALAQCSAFLENAGQGVETRAVANTAVAAETVAASGRKDMAAICSHRAAELNGLKILQSGIQDARNNYTRFICIAKDPEIYPGADRTSFMVTLQHRPGSLYRLLAKFYALDINLLKLESRPIPERDFEFTFYFDIETSVYSEEFARLMCDLQEAAEEFHYLGSYSEVI